MDTVNGRIAVRSVFGRRFVVPTREDGNTVRQHRRQQDLNRQLENQRQQIQQVLTGSSDLEQLEELYRPTAVRGPQQQQQQERQQQRQQWQQQTGSLDRELERRQELYRQRRLEDLRQHQRQRQKHQQREEAKEALAKALWSAVRSPTGEIDPKLLSAALNKGLPKQAIMNAASEALERATANRKEVNDASQQQHKRIEHLEKQLKRKDKQLNNGSCIICMDEPRNHVFVPCGHVCTCQSCSNELIDRERKENNNGNGNGSVLLQCPICKQDSHQVIQLFHP